MIPWLVKIQFGGHYKKRKRIWIPLPLVYIPLLVLAALLSPLLLIVAIVLLVWKGFNMFKATAACLMMLAATRGFLIDVSSAKQNFQIAVK
ncbi:MAG: hypothetical protein PVI38_11720 [Desulfobacterales bacterium]|jgi:hypothetical protein